MVRTGKMLGAAAAVLVAGMAAPAQAVLLQYTVTGYTTASFQIDSQRPPDFVSDPEGFGYSPFTGIFNGVEHVVMFNFVAGWLGGGIEAVTAQNAPVDDPTQYFFSMVGPQMFSGPLTSPTLLTGEWDTTDYFAPDRNYHVSVTVAGGAVPEPATWGMMILGLGAIAGALRSRKRAVRLVA